MGLRSNPMIIIVLLLVVVALFGSSKLPDLARSVGQSLKILKRDVKDLREDGAPHASSTPAAPTSQVPPTTQTVEAAPVVPTPAPAPSPVAPSPDVAGGGSVEGDATPNA